MVEGGEERESSVRQGRKRERRGLGHMARSEQGRDEREKCGDWWKRRVLIGGFLKTKIYLLPSKFSKSHFQPQI